MYSVHAKESVGEQTMKLHACVRKATKKVASLCLSTASVHWTGAAVALGCAGGLFPAAAL